MVKNLNQDQVKSKGEEENKKPGLWERTKQILKPAALIAAATIGFLLGGPIGVALVLGVSAFVSHKIDQRNARKNADKDNKGNKNNSDSRDKENKKEGKGPGFLKRAMFIAGAIALGVLTGGLAGPIAAIALIVFDFASGGKLTKWSEKVVTAPFKLIKEAWSKGKEIQWTSKRDVGKETEQKKGKEQAAGQGVAEKEREKDNSAVGLPNPKYSPAVRAENPNASVVKAAGTVQKSPPGGRGDDGNPTNKTMSPEVQRQVEQAAKPGDGVEVEETVRQSSPGEMQRSQSVDRLNRTGYQQSNKATSKTTDNIDDRGLRERADKLMENLRQPSTGGPSTSNQPVPPKTQGQAAQPAKPEDGVKAEGTNPKRPVVGPATGGLAQESPGKGFERGSSN